MAMKSFNPFTPSRRYMQVADNSDITRSKPEKTLLAKHRRTGGRDQCGHSTDVNMGGGHKRRYRIIDFRRDKLNVPGKVAGIEYDPNRSARIALIYYVDGEKRYILAPKGLTVGETIMAGPEAEIKAGNSLPLKNIPTGQPIHNIELELGAGGRIVRSAGCAAQLLAKEGTYATLRLPSGEIRRVFAECYATIGEIGNADHQNMVIGKAGRSRWLGRRPHNHAIARNPVDHPMGGRTNGGRHPCNRNGLKAKGLKTRNNKRTDKFIITRCNDKIKTA